MEQKLKILASSSCEGEGSIRSGRADRFSGLPDGLAYRILSFLSVKDLTCFSIVSKRCRELYLSTPSLDFKFMTTITPTGEYACFSKATCEVRLELVNSLDRFLLQRGDNKIEYFHLAWESHSVDEDSDEESDEAPCFCVNERFRIVTWIHNALRCNVEVLDVTSGVHDYEDEPYAFPSCVFLCATLTSLAVDMNHTIVKTPSVAFSSNLVDLKLINVEIEDERFFKWISCSCKFIKEIFLFAIRKTENITIESSSLEKFEYQDGIYTLSHLNISGEKLEVINISWRFHSPGDKSLNIFAPILKDLGWRGNLMNQANLGKLECLEQASICLDPEADDFDGDNLFEVFCSLHRAEYLVLNEATITALFRDGSTHAQFDNLFYLHMTVRSFSDELVPAMVSLLKGMPNLCTLYIGHRPSSHDPKSDASGFDMEYWKLQNLRFVDQIEEVTIELSDRANGIEFARYILENAKTLEKMVIIYLPEQSDVIHKLNESKKMSKAAVIVREKQRRLF